jgi:hypothetical protein
MDVQKFESVFRTLMSKITFGNGYVENDIQFSDLTTTKYKRILINISYSVDMLRLLEGSNKYDRTYAKLIWNVNDNTEKVLKYMGLHDMDSSKLQINYDFRYENTHAVNNEVNDLYVYINNRLRQFGFSEEEIEEFGFSTYVWYQEEENVWMVLNCYSDNDVDGIDENQIEEWVINYVHNHCPLLRSFDSDIDFRFSY